MVYLSLFCTLICSILCKEYHLQLQQLKFESFKIATNFMITDYSVAIHLINFAIDLVNVIIDSTIVDIDFIAGAIDVNTCFNQYSLTPLMFLRLRFWQINQLYWSMSWFWLILFVLFLIWIFFALIWYLICDRCSCNN